MSAIEMLAEELAGKIAALLSPLLVAPMTPVEEPWRLLTVTEAAARLGRSTKWVRERAKRGDLPWVRLDGGALAFEVADLQAFATARRVSVDGPDPLAAAISGSRNGTTHAGPGGRDPAIPRRGSE